MLNLVKLNKENINILNKINEFNSPSRIYIPIIKETSFRIDDYIYKNSLFSNHVSSISGYVKSVKEILINNEIVSAIEVENDYKENSKLKKKAIKAKNKEELIKLLNEYFFDSILHKINGLDIIKNLVVTSIDEEEYSYSEFMLLSRHYDEVLDAIDNIANILNIHSLNLALKSTNYNSIKNVKSKIGSYPEIKVTLVPDLYLIGHKKFICKYLNLKENETLVLTTSEIYELYNVLKNGKYITSKLVTISGNALAKSKIIDARLYTPLSDILKEYFKLNTDIYSVYVNGILMGNKIDEDKVVITRDTHTIVINKKEIIKETECINCGACRKICPMDINVKKCYFNSVRNPKCIGCGLCEYICPAKIRLKEVVYGGNNEKIQDK